MSGYTPSWELLPMAATSSLFFYAVHRKIFRMVPSHAAMFSVIVTLFFGWGGMMFAVSFGESYWEGVANLTCFMFECFIILPIIGHAAHIVYIYSNGRTVGRRLMNYDERVAALRGERLRKRLEAMEEAERQKYLDSLEWAKVRRKYLRDILLNRFDDTSEPKGGH